MRKRMSWMMAVLATAAIAAGCSGGETTDTAGSSADNAATEAGESGETAPAGDATEVIFWSSMSGGMGETLDKIVSDYNASQDAVHVTVEFQGNYYDMAAKLQAAVTSGEIPHVAQLEMGRTKMFADYGVLQDMTDLAAESGLDLSMFYPGLMNSCDWGEGVYALPFNRSTPMFYYNKDMFTEVGLDPEDPPETWDELQEYAAKLSIPDERWGFEMPKIGRAHV